MKQIQLDLSPLHASAINTYLLIVMKNYVSGKMEGTIPGEKMTTLEQADLILQKLDHLSEASSDDETPQPVFLSLAEAEAFIRIFVEEDFQKSALQDDFYQQYPYSTWFSQIFAQHLELLSEKYVHALMG